MPPADRAKREWHASIHGADGSAAAAAATRGALSGTGRLTDGRVLQGLADEMDVDLRLPTPEAARAELLALGSARRPAEGAGLDVPPPPAPSLREGEAVLATWRQLIDWCVDGVMTARPVAFERVLRDHEAPEACR